MSRFTDDNFGLTWLMSSFHADWSSYAESEAEAVENALWDGLDPRHVMLLRRDAVRLLERLPAESVEQLWESGIEVSDFFGRRVQSGDQWMRLIIKRCDAWLLRGESVSLSEVDQEDGFSHSDEVLNELGRAIDLLGSDLVSDLGKCARHCSPDLAFRFLLQSLECRGEKIGQPRYERLEGIGSALHYGEFLVSKLEHLVN
ncbi:hypothetical protein ACWCY1_37750 [Streptomyces goshikiensis]|uniref:hypothetical protein n=1 Tax=Streptomyces TaxID=1883 RepID=UPI00093F5BF3|nr:hypothetical protein [Streptomyces sp. CB03578]